MSKSSEQIEIDPTKHYTRVTVRLWGKGVVKRDEQFGASIAAKKQRIVRSQQFVLSRIDARHGAFGLIPDSLDGAISSQDFPSFDLDKSRIIPKFIEWMSKTRSFISLCNTASEGTTNRVRLKETRFLGAKILLPSLKDQSRIIAWLDQLNEKVGEARGLRKQARDALDAMLTEQLRAVYAGHSKRHVVKPLGQVCNMASGGTPSRARPDFFEGNIPWIKSGELEDELIVRSQEYISEAAVLTSNAKVFPQGTLLVALYGATVGKTGVLGMAAATNQAICAIFPNESLNRDYVWWFLRSMRPVFLGRRFGGAQPNISQRMLRRTGIPVPSLSEQQRLAAYFAELNTHRIQLGRSQAETGVELESLLPEVLDRTFAVRM